MREKGCLTIEKENVFEILKKWLYQEEEIVFRELISNASDAITKRNNLDCSFDGGINVIIDPENGTITIRDNGVGMTKEEVDNFINKIAFSGTKEYINSHSSDYGSEIGHFGVGFYSSFMLSSHVTIESKSYLNEPAVTWDGFDTMEYEISPSEKKEVGILYMDKNHAYIKEPKYVKAILEKYFAFLPYPLYLHYKGDSTRINPNNAFPTVSASMTDEEMNDFYKLFFKDGTPPLFRINLQSPDIGLSGVLFFKNQEADDSEGNIMIYNKGVYVGKNISSLIPKYLKFNNGIIHCDRLPLVVSRSQIRDDNANDISALIKETLSQEVTIYLHDQFTNHRENLVNIWNTINPFIKYGILQDKILASVMGKKILFENGNGKYVTINEYLENGETENIVYYVSDSKGQSEYTNLFDNIGVPYLIMDHVIDQVFLKRMEFFYPKTLFLRIDSHQAHVYDFKEGVPSGFEGINDVFAKLISEKNLGLNIRWLSDSKISLSSNILFDEESRRASDAMELFSSTYDEEDISFPPNTVLLINSEHPLIEKINHMDNREEQIFLSEYLLNLALIQREKMSLSEQRDFFINCEVLLKKYIALL